MTKHVLIVHPNLEMIHVVRDILQEVGLSEGLHLSVNWAKNQAAAENKAKEAPPIDLVITALEIAAGERPQEGAGEEGKRGIELIRGLRKKRPTMAAILIITGHMDDELLNFVTEEDAGLAQEGQQYEGRLRSEVRRQLATGTIEPPAPKRVDIEISLEPANCTCTFWSEGQSLYNPAVFTIDAQTLGYLAHKSQRIDIDDPERWKMQMREVGEALAHEIFQQTPESLRFSGNFSKLCSPVGNENIRICFKAQDEFHPIALEALKKKHDDYLMLQRPIYRSEKCLHYAAIWEARGPFQGKQARDRPINFLIIQADVPANANVIIQADVPANANVKELKIPLEPLPCVRKEVAAIEARLTKLKQQGAFVGKVRVIRPDTVVPTGQSFIDVVEDTLKDTWHVVHYAGHTHYEPKDRTGYVFFPGSGCSPVEPVKIDLFARWLKRSDTRFVFLSSCKSVKHDFIYHLAKHGIPAIMGFLWKVNDEKAKGYADSLYGHLLSDEERSPEYACLEAKREMHAKYEDDPIWASPVLVMQVGP